MWNWLIFLESLRVLFLFINILRYKFSESLQKYILLHDTYKTYYSSFVFAVISVCYILITPFVKLYTNGIDDIKYVDSYLPMLYCI